MGQDTERRRRASDAFQDLFQILLGINLAVIEKGEPGGVLDVLLDAAVRLFEVDWCSLGLLDEMNGDLRFTVHTGQMGVATFLVPKGQGFAGWVAKTGKPVLCNNPAQDPRFDNAINAKTGLVTHSLMCAPLRYHQKVLGIIQIRNTQKEAGFTEADLRLLASFGELAGVAINGNATLQVADHAGSIYREDAEQRYAMIGGKSQAMKKVIATARKAAPSAATILLMSESGTGKEVMAHGIHRWSRRSQMPFVAVNCVALTPELLGSELFGHEKGAFTGASDRKLGKFELANEGTIFLDEIGELTLELQARLLRVLQEKEIQRVGGNREIRIDVRIIAATNRNLGKAVAEGRFREDLFYRLNVLTLELPPLRERREEIPDLASHFLRISSREAGRMTPSIEKEAIELLIDYPWPGNVRQLRNTIERAVVLTPGANITTDSLPPEIREQQESHAPPHPPITQDISDYVGQQCSLAEAVDRFKRSQIQRALNAHGGNQAKAAEMLGLKPSNLSRMLKKQRTRQI